MWSNDSRIRGKATMGYPEPVMFRRHYAHVRANKCDLPKGLLLVTMRVRARSRSTGFGAASAVTSTSGWPRWLTRFVVVAR
jgi:hypothetical protein